MSIATISSVSSKKHSLITTAESMVREGKHGTEEYRTLIKTIDETQAHLELLERFERAALSAPTPLPVQAAPVSNVPTVIRTTTEQEGVQRRDTRARLNAALRHAIQFGTGHGNETRDLKTISDTTGAALFGQTMEEQEEWTRALANVAPLVDKIHTKMSPTGAARKFVVTDQTAQYMLTIPETTATDAADTTPTIHSTITGNLAPIIGRTTVSFQTLADVDDLIGYLRDGFAVQAARAQELAILKSIDHASTALVSSPSGGLLAASPVGATVATVNQISPADIANLGASLDYSYFLEGDYLASQNVYAYLAAQLKTTGEYLYPRDAKGNLIVNGKTLMVASNTAMAGMSASVGTPLLLCGSFRRAWGATLTPFRLQILEPSPETLTNQVVASFRIGQVALISNAVKSLVQ